MKKLEMIRKAPDQAAAYKQLALSKAQTLGNKIQHHNLYDTDQYHCTADCLSKVGNTHMRKLNNTKWNVKTEKEVIEALDNVTTPKGY